MRNEEKGTRTGAKISLYRIALSLPASRATRRCCSFTVEGTQRACLAGHFEIYPSVLCTLVASVHLPPLPRATGSSSAIFSFYTRDRAKFIAIFHSSSFLLRHARALLRARICLSGKSKGFSGACKFSGRRCCCCCATAENVRRRYCARVAV